MLKFVDLAPKMPDKRPPQTRVKDFREVFEVFEVDRAAAQASRCSQCGIPFCQVHCPLHNNIADWLKLTAEGRVEEAYELAAATNNMPEVCGRICPQDRLCEGNCVIERGFGTVTIGAIENYIVETAFANGWVRALRPSIDRPETVGIVGAGPAGLAAAEQLRRKGYGVDVYDRYDRVGGLLIYGIPNFKLEKYTVERRTALLREGGVRFHLGVEIGRDVTLAELRDRHDAILIATGVYQARALTAPGTGLGNVFPAMTYLTASNRKGLGDSVPAFDDGPLDAAGKRVVVVGGGDTAMDCVRTAVRQGAASVKCLYRRDRANMPGSMREVTHAEEEGVEFVWLSAPEALLGNGAVSAVRARRVRLGVPDGTGRQVPEAIPESSFTVDADLVVLALGFDPEDMSTMLGTSTIDLTRWGTIQADFTTLATSLADVFAAGDIIRGASLVVWAIRDGREASESIHTYLRARAAAGGRAEAGGVRS